MLRTVSRILEKSAAPANLVREGKAAIVGAVYDVTSGEPTFLTGETIDGKSTDVGEMRVRHEGAARR